MKTKAQKARKAGKDSSQGKGEGSFFCFTLKHKVLFLFCLKNKMEFDGC